MRTSSQLHLPTLLWALITAVGLLIPGSDLTTIDPEIRWLPAIAHFVLNAVLALLLFRSLADARPGRPSSAIVFAACFAYTGLLEVGQLWVPGRSWEVADLWVNGAGALVGVLMARRVYPSAADVSPSTL